jgi:hypothetical protein
MIKELISFLISLPYLGCLILIIRGEFQIRIHSDIELFLSDPDPENSFSLVPIIYVMLFFLKNSCQWSHPSRFCYTGFS